VITEIKTGKKVARSSNSDVDPYGSGLVQSSSAPHYKYPLREERDYRGRDGNGQRFIYEGEKSFMQW